MKAGNFNIHDYLSKLNEEADAESLAKLPEKDGLIIPDTNKKNYDWLKSEYQKGKTEVKVEMKMGGSKFEPGYDLQTDQKSVKDFKPGMYGAIKTSDTEGNKKKEEPTKETKKSGEKPKEDVPKEDAKKDNPNQLKVDLKTKKDDKK